jgi:hypothetical protein
LRFSLRAARRASSLPVGVLAAGALAVGLYRQRSLGPGGSSGYVLGSFFALLALFGVAALARRWRDPVAAWTARLRARVARSRFPWLARASRWLLAATALLVPLLILSHWFRHLALSFDHAEHCFKAYHFWTEMLARGRLKGWSHVLNFGYPSGELTPFGPELWVALFRAATLGLLSWTRTYALAFAGMSIFATVALFVFARRFFGVAAGLVAAAIWILDTGGWYQGGWFWFAWLGVWPVTLAMSFTLLALVKLSDVLAPERGLHRRGDVLWAALWMTASLVTHQLAIVVYPVAVPALLLGAMLRDERLPEGAAARFAGALALGVGMAAFYLVPMFARNGLTQDLGVRGYSLEELGHRLVELRLFEHGWALILVLALVGGVVVVRSRSVAGPFFVVCGAAFVLLSSDILISLFHAERVTRSILKLECQRMLLVAKLFWFPLAGLGAVTLFRQAFGAPRGSGDGGVLARLSPGRRLACVVVVAALGAPLLRPMALHVYQTQVTKEVQVRNHDSIWLDLKAFLEWSRVERESTKELYRIAYFINNQHDHIVSLSPVFNQTMLYKVGYTSAQQFVRFPMSSEPELYQALSVKYLLSENETSDGRFAPVRTFGQLHVYRFTGYQPQHPFTLVGDGQVELEQFDPELIRLRLRGVAPGSRLKLHVARFPRWEATLDGRTLPISPATAYGMDYPFLMEVPAGDGELVFRYVRRGPDWAGLGLTWLALLGFAAVATRLADGPARRLAPALQALRGRLARGAGRAVVVGVAVVLGAGGLAGLVRKMASPSRLSPDSVYAVATPETELSLGGTRCQALSPTKWQCGPNEIRAEVVAGDYGSHFCMTAPTAGTLVLSTRTRLGRFVEASHDPYRNTPGRISVSVEGKVLGETGTRGPDQGLQFLQVDTREHEGRTAALRVELEGGPLHCFDVKLVP